MNHLKEKCGNCGLSRGSHSASSYFSSQYKMEVLYNACPGREGRMDWDHGPGTCFKPTGEKVKKYEYNKKAKGYRDTPRHL